MFQTGTTIQLPQPVGSAELNLVTQSWGHAADTLSYTNPMTGMNLNGMTIRYGDYYSPANNFPQFVDGDAITLQGLFKWRKENIDWRQDAKTTPGYFSPACGFTGQLLLLGGNCQISFGWYNVADPNSTTPPAANEIYEFIPSNPSYLNCKDENGGAKTDGFCPLAWDTLSPRNLYIHQWTPTPFDSGNIKMDTRYKGGYVGFAVIGNPATMCTQNKYSMQAYNQKNTAGQPWVTTLIYQSTVDPEGFYMAFEDLPMTAADWTNGGKVDGDFNDFVFYISGISCAGGNQACDTGLQGACSVGRTDCAATGETPVCRPVVQPGTEICDNVDNDCNGMVDDGDGLCPDPNLPFCVNGSCVGNCGNAEFPCPAGLSCDATGRCIDPACVGVTCPMGQACRAGNCVDPCNGVVCPYGSQCELGQCVDPCAGVTCPTGRVCSKGLCVADCSCNPCAAGLTCGSDGRCVDTACATVSCAAGQVCQGGTCVDPCAGVVCPGGGTCSNGVCSRPTGGTTTTSATGSTGSVVFAGAGGGAGNAGTGGNSGGTGGSGSGTGGTGGGKTGKGVGCSCRVDGTDGESSMGWLAAALGIGLLARRRRETLV